MNADLAAAPRRHAPGRWAYSAETMTELRNNAPSKGKNKGHSKGKQFLGNPNSSSSAASAALPRREVVDTIVGNFASPTPSTEVLGHGPYWISHVSQFLTMERAMTDTGPLAFITHDIGLCPSTCYFATGTCLNDVEIDLLLQACVIIPNGAAFGYYVRPQLRTLGTPPWVQSAMQHYFARIESQFAEMISNNPLFATGGPILRLSTIHSANKFAFDAFLTEARNEYCEAHPREARAWEWLIIQYLSRQYLDELQRTIVRPAAVTLQNDLDDVSNSVNARYYDYNGSLYFTFYNGGFRHLDAQFPPGLSQGNLPSKIEIMMAVSMNVVENRSSLIWKWLHSHSNAQRDDFTPGQASRSVSPRLSDSSSMDVDS